MALQHKKGNTWPCASSRYQRRFERTGLHDLLEHLVVASEQGPGASDEDSDTDGIPDDGDIDGVARAEQLQIKDDMDLRSSTSTFEREGRSELEGQMMAGSWEKKKRVLMVRFDTA